MGAWCSTHTVSDAHGTTRTLVHLRKQKDLKTGEAAHTHGEAAT